MRALTSQEFALTVFMSVCEAKSRSRLADRRQSLIIDDCIDLLKDGPLCPSVLKYKPGGFDPEDQRRRQLCADTLAFFEEVAPFVRVMAEHA